MITQFLCYYSYMSNVNFFVLKFSSVLGEIAAAFAQDKKLQFDLSPFSLSRFVKNKL